MEMKIKVVTPTMKANDDLFYKMQLEFEETMEEITKLPSEEMFEIVHEITMKQIILKCMEVRDISYKAAKAFLMLDYPLEYMFAGYVETFDSYDNIYDFIENCGNNLYAAFKHAE